mmetsp:Transcript_30709/g.74148  ORF Transcript_30709/g.74148 Transcript_30709/m.74148 type:complete len:112 (-) Transcript_30709:82-417(-)
MIPLDLSVEVSGVIRESADGDGGDYGGGGSRPRILSGGRLVVVAFRYLGSRISITRTAGGGGEQQPPSDDVADARGGAFVAIIGGVACSLVGTFGGRTSHHALPQSQWRIL